MWKLYTLQLEEGNSADITLWFMMSWQGELTKTLCQHVIIYDNTSL